MNKLFRVGFYLFLVVAMALGAAGPALALPERSSAGQTAEGRYIVRLKPMSTAAARGSAIQRVKDKGGKVLFEYKAGFSGYAAILTAAQLAAVKADMATAEVRPDVRISLSPIELATQKPVGVGDVNAKGLATQPAVTWGLDRIDQRDITLNNTYNYTTTASNVHAYVIDTGLASGLAEFQNRVGNGIDMIDLDNNAIDCNGHGTHVAGTIASTTYGVAKKAIVHPVRVLDCEGSGYWSGVVAGMEWVISNHSSPAVANMSLGGEYDDWINDTVEAMVDAGITVVVAAGNEAEDACFYSPASASGAISVGATDTMDRLTYFSNFGMCVDIFAPGDAITSTSKEGKTAVYSGTSMASPHVAGVAALYLADNPTAEPSEVATWLGANATANAVVDDLGDAPNLFLFSMANGGEYVTPLWPTGIGGSVESYFLWRPIQDATAYKLRLVKGTTTRVIEVDDTDLSGYRGTVVTGLARGSKYKWSVSYYKNGAWSNYGPAVDLNVVKLGTGFNSKFTNDMLGWTGVLGKWTIGGGNLNNNAKAGMMTSVVNSGYYDSFNFKARYRRTETCLWGYCLPTVFWFGANPSSTDNWGFWREGVAVFLYNDEWMRVVMVRDFTWYDIAEGSVPTNWQGWNDLEVDVSGDDLYININGYEVELTDAIYSLTGKVGFGQYGEAATDKLSVDSVILVPASQRFAPAEAGSSLPQLDPARFGPAQNPMELLRQR